MRLLAIGDVHGSFDRLKKLLTRICLQQDDQLVMLGDYIDRGPDTKEVIECLFELKSNFPDTVFLRGNHEQMLLDALFGLGILDNWEPLRESTGRLDPSFGTDACLFEMNGGLTTLRSYGVEPADALRDRNAAYRMIPQAHVDFLKNTSLYYRHRNFLFVHAGINGQDPLGEKFGPYDLLWQRKHHPCWIDGQEMTIVHGHTPCLAPLFDDTEINIDTGAGHGRELTCCNLLTGEFWQE